MGLKIFQAPAVEPVTLEEARRHCGLDSAATADDLEIKQTIAPGSYANFAEYSLEGSAVDLAAYASAIAELAAGEVGAGGTVDIKLQDSDDGQAFTDVEGGAFSQVTDASDNRTTKLGYEGGRRYLRAVASVALAGADFGVSIIAQNPVTSRDTDILRYIRAGRRLAEKFQRRVFITQIWDLQLDFFPGRAYIEIPKPPLQSVAWLKYRDAVGEWQTVSFTDPSGSPIFETPDYVIDTFETPARLALAYGSLGWPTTYPEIASVKIRFSAGYGDAAADVPEEVRQAILLAVGNMNENRGDVDPVTLRAMESLLYSERALRL